MTAPTFCTHRASAVAFTYEQPALDGERATVAEAAWCDACGSLFTLPEVDGMTLPMFTAVTS